MQLHTLTFAAIGPFRDEQRIDFGALAAAGLFLLDGPTGAGKSTVIDAVVFALYGDVAGRGSSKDRLVSDHRELGAEPFVDLVFETGGGVYRVRRTPEHERPKKRGEGTVTQPGSVKLWKATSPDALDGDPISTRAGEADAEIRDVIGLSREQFVKTVVLPQGEFARFLQSRSDERRDILQSIFGTEHYDSVQDELKARRILARQACDDADRRLRLAAEAFTEAAALDDAGAARILATVDAVPAALVSELDAVEADLRERTYEVVERLDAGHLERVERCARVESQRDEAAEQLRQRQQQLERRDRLRAALAEKDVLEATRADHRHREQRLDAARRTATCRVAFDAVDEARSRLDHASRRVDELRATVELDGVDVTVAGHGEVTQAYRELRDTIVALSDAHELEAGLPDRRDELRTLRRDHEKLVANLAEIQARCTALPAEIEALQSELATAGELAATLTASRRERTDVEALLAVHDQLEGARQQHDDAEQRCRAALEQLAEADEQVAELRRRYREGVAADLAVELADGVPCQVCGSTQHPEPAARSHDFVSREQVEDAERSRQECQRHLDGCRDARASTAAKVAELEGRLDGSTADTLRARLGELCEAITAGESAQHRVTELGDAVKRRKAELSTSLDQQRQAETDIARLDTRIESCAERLERDEARVAAQRGEFATVAARLADLRRRAAHAEKLATALAELDNRTAEHTTRTQQLDAAVAAAGFDAAEPARMAMLASEQLRELQAEVDDWLRRSHASEGRLAAPELADVDPDAEIDVDAARALAEARESEWRELQRSTATAEARLAHSRDAGRALTAALTSRRREYDAAAPIIRMAGLVNADSGDNVLRMALATYVLQRRFDHVVQAANERLADMSAGRYALESYDGKQSGSRRTGLGLQVIDAHTGVARETGTLSGGETFYVSLALALGLADVVTSEAGGLRMGTLFVDEGFGSLDPDTLDSVMGVLADLRSGGRVVGVVSHVDELKTRIPERIEVRRPVHSGPSTLTVVA